MRFLERYKEFLNQMEEISCQHNDVTDTDVRERLRSVIEFYFVWGNEVTDRFPKRYSMPVAAADKLIADAAKSFVIDASGIAVEQGILPGSERHMALEDDSARTSRGTRYDVFIGSSDSPLPARKPDSDRNYRYFSKTPDLYGSLLNGKRLELTVDGHKARIDFDHEVRQYVCWFVGQRGTAYFSAKEKKELQQAATRVLRDLAKNNASEECRE